MRCFLRCAGFFGIGTAALMGLMAVVTGFVVALSWIATAIAGQDSITITVMDENRGGRWIKRPNYETKWGRFFTEVK